MTENRMRDLISAIDSYDYYVKDKVARDTEENRKGQFALTFTDAEGHPLDKVRYVVRQKTHEFNFGTTTFYLGGFDDDARNRTYEDRFTGLFNYAVLPMYWDTLEPEQGKPCFEEGCAHIDRRPPFDRSAAFCRKNHLRMKGHCLVYNSFQPDWIPEDTRQLKILIEKRVAEIAARCGDAFEDMDVINEMISIYKNAYPGNGMRNLSITDEPDHEKWAFRLAEKYFPHTRLFWNEGGYETFGSPQYVGFRSFFYMALKENLAKGAPIGGIGMQYHCYAQPQNVDTKLAYLANPLRILDVLERYGDFGLPIHISEVNVPSWSNNPEDEALQAELVKRLYRLWFSQKHVAGVVWWNLADGTALPDKGLKGIRSFTILHGGWGRPVAVCLEGKLTESGLAQATVSDFRNYCHGRFIHTSNHLEETAVVMLVTPRERDLAERIRKFLPGRTRLFVVETPEDSHAASLDLLIRSTALFEDLCAAEGTNPDCPPNPGRIDKRVPIWIPFIKAMKDSGIGRPSTYAPTISTSAAAAAILFDPFLPAITSTIPPMRSTSPIRKRSRGSRINVTGKASANPREKPVITRLTAVRDGVFPPENFLMAPKIRENKSPFFFPIAERAPIAATTDTAQFTGLEVILKNQ